VVGALVLGMAIYFIPSFNEMFLSPSRIYSISKRLSLFKGAFYAFKEHPLLGVGYKNYEPLSKIIQRDHQIEPVIGGAAHNNFLELLASTGLLGFLVLVFFHYYWFRELWRRTDFIGQIGPPIVVALFISGQSEYTFGDGEILFVIMAFYTLTQVNFKTKI